MRVHGLVVALLLSSQHFVCFLLRMVSCDATKRDSTVSHSDSVWAGTFMDVMDMASEMPGCVVIVVVARIKTICYLQHDLVQYDEVMACRGGLDMPCAWCTEVVVGGLGIWRCFCCGCQTRELWAFVAVVREDKIV